VIVQRRTAIGIADRGLGIADCKLATVIFFLRLRPRPRSSHRMTTKELKERTFRFGVRIIRVVESLQKSEIGRILGHQLLRAGTSVGANYRAAARARSRADFIAKLGIVEEECDEAIFWMQLLIEVQIIKRSRVGTLLKEGDELLSIVVTSINTARKQPRK
jgi:four helix bundle protein